MYSSGNTCDRNTLRVFLVLLMFTFFGLLNGDDSVQEKRLYIVYMGSSSSFESKESMVDPHVSVLSEVVGSMDAAKESIIHSYRKHFNAFAADLSPAEAERLRSSGGVISVFPNQHRELHTTKSWDFLGFPQNVARNLKLETNLVVGVIDSGITPDSESFSDQGFGPPPSKWKGTCGPYVNFSGCNNKIVGARYFKLDQKRDPAGTVLSPLDTTGHGTHTSSIILGNIVNEASLFGIGKGTVRGAVPSARVAAYKVCWEGDCQDVNILAAFEAAIEDGVDIVSISLGGGGSGSSYFTSSIAVGSFHAMRKGIITVAAAGNGGPDLGSVTNDAPWLLTVAASGINRKYVSKVRLGDGRILSGVGVNTFTQREFYPLIRGVDAVSKSGYPEYASWCGLDSLDPKKVNGKVVACDNYENSESYASGMVSKAGGVGTIVLDSPDDHGAAIFQPCGSAIDNSSTKVINKYIESTRSPLAKIYKAEEVNNVTAPFVASFSGRGPSYIGSGRSLKPDITAPGVDILAAYSPLSSISEIEGDSRHSKYNILSGTSMACPHVAGVVAYVKAFHPDWSPAAVKSAIMTTATPMKVEINFEAELAYGAGQVNPLQAVDPGLVFDMHELHYVQFLCNEGYSNKEISYLIATKTTCSKLRPTVSYDSLNYPMMGVRMNTTNKTPVVAIFKRTLTNVGPAKSVYNATTRAAKGVKITVTPMSLVFSKKFQKFSFTVVVKPKRVANHEQILSSSLTWISNTHRVRSPIVVYTLEEETEEPEEQGRLK